MEKKKKLKRSLIEWGIIITIGAILYITGLHTQVIGTIQGLILETGIIKPDISTEGSAKKADYRFTLVDSEGQSLTGEALKGKVVFMNFWATWCPPCVAEMPDIDDLHREMKKEKNIAFIMVSMDEDFQKAIEFVDKKNFDFKVYQFASSIPEVYSSRVIPTTYVLSPDGEIVVRKQGMAKYDSRSFRKFLRSL